MAQTVCKLKLIVISMIKLQKLHNEELHDLYSSPNIVRVIKSRRKRWAGHVVHMGCIEGFGGET